MESRSDTPKPLSPERRAEIYDEADIREASPHPSTLRGVARGARSHRHPVSAAKAASVIASPSTFPVMPGIDS